MAKLKRNEWALGVSVEGAGLVVPVLTSERQLENVRIQELGERGLPTAGALCARLLGTNLDTWGRASASEYLAGFGLSAADAGDGRHVVYWVSDGGRRYLVPALALMRAIFRPTRFFLPDMFLAQALDHLCYSDTRAVPHGLKVTAAWAQGAKADRRTNVTGVLAWLRATPDNRELAASVHSYAMQGCLALKLPPVVANVVPWGVEIGTTVYVTELSLKSLLPADAPTPANAAARRRQSFNLYGKGAAIQTVAGLAKTLRLEPRADGQMGLLDAEWAVVEPLLASRVARRRPEVAFRDIVETVFAKVACGYGTTWPVVNRLGIQEPLLAYYYRRWATSGALEASLEKLNELRTVADEGGT